MPPAVSCLTRRCRESPSMAGNLCVLLRGKNTHQTARCIGADHGLGCVSRRIEHYAERGQVFADSGPHGSVMFADTAGKDEQLGSIENGRHSRDMLANGIAK